MNNFIVIPTVGRAELLDRLLSYILEIIPLNWRIVVVGTASMDFPRGYIDGDFLDDRLDFYLSTKGAAIQRNLGIEKILNDADIILLMDDDFFPVSNYFSVLERFFDENPDVVGVNAKLLFDGAGKGGVSIEEAMSIIKANDGLTVEDLPPIHLSTLYGCNMAVRSSALRKFDEWFDVELPLYSWLEDRDFSHRLSLQGQLVKLPNLLGGHLGYRQGRTSEVRYGYSQIANPIYLYRKRSLSFWSAFDLMFRPLLMNLLRFSFPEPWVDRRGRLYGNMRAMNDLLKSNIHPGNIVRM